MSAAQGGNGGAEVRVVIITTQYIETDEANFKSVVQRLTGKHSHHHIENPDHQPPPRRRRLCPPPSGLQVMDGVSSRGGNIMNLSSLSSASSSVKFSRGVTTFSDLDRLHTLPSWEEISQMCM